MLNQQGQNSLLVVSIPYTDDKSVVDLDYSVVLKGRKPIFWFRHFLSKYIYEGKLDKNEVECVNLLAGRIYHELELGIQEGLTPLEAHSLQVLLKEINGESVGFSNNQSLIQLHPYVCKTPFEYFGEKGELDRYPALKYRRREKRHHFQRYVGVGYKDKGAATDVSHDGSPSWAETAGNIDNALEKLSQQNRELIPVKEFKFLRKDVLTATDRSSLLKKTKKYAFDVYSNIEDPKITLWKPDPFLMGEYGFSAYFEWDDLSKISRELDKTISPVKIDGQNCFVILKARNKGSHWSKFH